MPSRKEILEDIKANHIILHVHIPVKVTDGSDQLNTVEATDEDIKNMEYWELVREWKQAKHTRNIIAGIPGCRRC